MGKESLISEHHSICMEYVNQFLATTGRGGVKWVWVNGIVGGEVETEKCERFTMTNIISTIEGGRVDNSIHTSYKTQA